jgi:hypothetical protein
MSFPERIDQKLVIAPHTKYYVDGELCDAVLLKVDLVELKLVTSKCPL